MSVRLFAALALPATARAALVRFRDAAADPAVWRPLDEAALHVTLAFIGHRPEADVERAVAALAALPARGAPRMRLDGALALPPRRPRVLAVALADPEGTLTSLQADVSQALADAGVYTPEPRAFRPHVTVARVRAGARATRALAAEPEPLELAGGDLTLFRSVPGRGGAVYEVLFARSA